MSLKILSTPSQITNMKNIGNTNSSRLIFLLATQCLMAYCAGENNKTL